MMDSLAELAAVAHAVREQSSELLHLADGVWHVGGDQTSKISREQLIAIHFGRLIVASRRYVIGNLSEDPRIRRCRAADHHGIAASLRDQTYCILGSADIAVADHGNTNGLLYRADHAPVGHSRVTLHARARMYGNGLDTHLLGHSRDVNRHDAVFIPPGTDFDRKGNANGSADGTEKSFQMRQVSQ